MVVSREEMLEKALQAAGRINPAYARALALARIAAVYASYGDARGAAAVEESLKTAEAVKYPHEKAKALAAAAAVLARSGQIDTARQHFSRAVLLARAAESPAQGIEALFRIAAGQVEAQMKAEAVNLLADLRSLVVKPENEVDSPAELVNIAELLDDMGLKETAFQVLDQALTITRAIPDKWFRLERLIEIADTFSTCGNTADALPVLSEAELLAGEIEEFSRPYFLLRLAEVYIALKKTTEAAAVLETIPALVDRAETDYEKAGGLIEIAARFLEIDRRETALDLLGKARTLSDSITNPKEKISLQTEIGEWLDEAGSAAEALELAGQACADCRGLVDRKSTTLCLGNLALLYVYLKDFQKAGQIVDEIVSNARNSPAKTAGLGAYGLDLAAEGQPELALKLAAVIKEPDVLVDLYIALAGG